LGLAKRVPTMMPLGFFQSSPMQKEISLYEFYKW